METVQKRRMWVVNIEGNKGSYLSHSSSPRVLKIRAIEEAKENHNADQYIKHDNTICDGCEQVSSPFTRIRLLTNLYVSFSMVFGASVSIASL
jgi:hypothetical protein